MKSPKGRSIRQKVYLQIIILLFLMIIGIVTDEICWNTNLYINESQSLVLTSVLQPSPSVSTQYENHSPISINGNADFITQASVENWPGNGTASAPYVIDGYNITGPSESNLIEIKDTDVHFRISNCLLRQGWYGIYLDNVNNGQVSNNTVNNNKNNGIYLSLSENNAISYNTVTNNSGDGISLLYSENNILSTNTLTNNGDGIELYYSGSNVILDNNLTNNRLTLHGDQLKDYLQADVANNSINEKALVYWQNINGRTVSDDAEQVILVNSTSVEVVGLKITDVQVIYCFNVSIDGNVITKNDYDYGIRFYHSKNSTISHNIVTDNRYTGIWLYFSENNNLVNNTVTNNRWGGISLSRSGNNTISSNTITNNSEEGIYLFLSDNNTILYNTVNNNGIVGIHLRNSRNTILSHNTIVSNSDDGIFLWFSENNILIDNAVINNSNRGISFHTSGYCIISQNTITYNHGDGIYLYKSGNCTISQNTFTNNTNYGVNLYSGSSNNCVQLNDFFGNNEGGSQARDRMNSNNTFKFNFWDDWVSPDSNVDGIVDDPYSIDGIEHNQDPYPLVAPNIHLVPLMVVYPTGGEILTGSVTIRWTTSIDSFGHAITYTVYYSEDNGTSWIMLATDLSTTSYVWDTTTVVTCSSCLVKVVARCTEGITVEDSSDIPFIVHNLSPLKLLFPTGGELLNGKVIIRWEGATDSLGHNINYTLYYSSDHGVNWDVLEEGVKTTNYVWNTSLMEDNTTYQIKVVATCFVGLSTEVKSASFTVHNGLSPPTVLIPTANTTLNSIVTIRWTPSIDTLGHEVTYNLFYSSDGDSWLLIASDLTTPNYRWNTFTVPDGNNYLIKVVATCSAGLTTEATSRMFAIHNVGTYMWISASLVLVVVFIVVIIRSLRTVYSRKKKSQVPPNHTSQPMEMSK